MGKRNSRDLYNQCTKLMNYHVILTMNDGSQFDGIIEDVDGDTVMVLVGEDVMPEEAEFNLQDNRQYGGPIRYRRFRRRAFPLAALAALSLIAYPYYAPPYYPYYYPY